MCRLERFCRQASTLGPSSASCAMRARTISRPSPSPLRNSEGQADDEAPLAEEVAHTYGTRHTTRVVTESEFQADLPRILEAMDQPSIDGINTWFVSKAAKEMGLKVAVSGLGGDELFGGYPSFHDIPKWTDLMSASLAYPISGSRCPQGDLRHRS